jgi:hypothetical protein
VDQAEEIRRWATSQELYKAAEAALTQQFYRACVGLAYLWMFSGDVGGPW